jgi:predicted amidohydrolase
MLQWLPAARRLDKIGPGGFPGEPRPHRTEDKYRRKPTVLMDPLRIALLHLAPRAADLAYNQRLVEHGIAIAAQAGANWIITPELATTGYTFAEIIGTDWIAIQPDAWLQHICEMARRHGVAIFIGHVERDQQRDTLHNSVFTITASGELLRQHRKINTLRIGSEAWSTPGVDPTVVELHPYGKVGILICADACSPGIAARLKANGARALVSSASWAPGLHGPSGEWERITELTGLPLFVCNRTGDDKIMSFAKAESVVAHHGRRLLSLTSTQSAVFLIEWSPQADNLRGQPIRLDIPESAH